MSNPEIRVRPSIRTLKARHKSRVDALKNLRVPYRQSATFLDRWVQKNFQKEGAPVGGWEPLKAGGRWRGKGANRKFDPAAQILSDTGRMRGSFFPFVRRRNAGVASDLPYSKPHEEGTATIPQRRILPKHVEVRGDIRDIFERHVKRTIR